MKLHFLSTYKTLAFCFDVLTYNDTVPLVRTGRYAREALFVVEM